MSLTENDHDRALDRVSGAEQIEALFVQNAAGSLFDGETLTLSGIGATTLLFSDRPDRVTAHVPTTEFVDAWGEGENSFAADPPNAVLSTFDGDEVNDVVLVLSHPELSGSDLKYAVTILDGDMVDDGGPNSLFIDVIGRPLTPVSFAGARRRGRRRARR